MPTLDRSSLLPEKATRIYETERLYVRGLCLADIDGPYFHWLNDRDVCRYNSHGLFPASRPALESFVRSLTDRTDSVVWAVMRKDNSSHIGNLSLQAIDWVARSAEFAILMGDKASWGKGYATEAATLLFTHGFSRLNLNRIYCGTAAGNTAMRRLAEKLKMCHEGTRRQAMFLDGEYADVLEYGLLHDEFLA